MSYVCDCEVCKADRAKRRERKAAKARAEAVRVAAALQATNARAADRELGTKIRERATRHLDTEWTCGDGQRVRVQSMNNAHLFFALAKAYRKEYPDARSRHAGIEALHSEALRRLTGLPGIVPVNPPEGFKVAAQDFKAIEAARVQRWNDEALARIAAGY